MSDLKTEIIVRSIKIFAIAYFFVLAFIFSFFIAKYIDLFFDYIYGDDYQSKNINILYLEALSQIIVLGIVSYILRNIIQLIPFPFEGIYGFQYLRVKEVTSPPTVTFFLFIFQYKYQQKLSYIKDKLTDTIS